MRTGGVLAPLRRSDFRRLWIAQTVSIVGDKINQVALSIMVYRQTGSLAQMGIVFGITFLPAALFGLMAGPLVDRWDRRRTMLCADLARACLVIAIPFAAPLGMWAVYALAFSSATVSLFFEPSRMALVPSVVERDELMAANALDSTTMSVAELLGIGFAGGLVATVGPASAFIFDGATFVVSALFVLAVRHRAATREMRPFGLDVVRQDLREGFDSIRRSPVLRAIVLTYGALAIGVGAAITLGVVFALTVAVGPALSDAMRVAVVDLSTTAGLLVGSIAIGIGGTRLVGRKYLLGIVACGVVFLPLYLVRDIGVAAVVLFAAGLANQYFTVPMITIVQSYTTDENRGRVFSVRTTITRTAGVIGLVGAGIAAEAYGVPNMILVAGTYMALIGILGFLMPALRDA